MDSSNVITYSAKSTHHEKEDVDRLFRNLLSGDEFAFKKLFLQTSGPLFAMAYGIVNSNSLAEEIVHDVFIRIWKKRNELKLNGSAKAYLNVSVRNMSFDYIRKYRKTFYHEDITSHSLTLSENHDPLKVYCYEELYQRVQTAISSLPEQCQIIFRLSREKDLKYKEIAKELNISIKTVETQMGRAIKKIKKLVYDG